MVELLFAILIVLVLTVIGLQIVSLRRRTVGTDSTPVEPMFKLLEAAHERTERSMRDEIARSREESASIAKQGREELSGSFRVVGEAIWQQVSKLTTSNEQKLELLRDSVDARLRLVQQDGGAKLDRMQEDAIRTSRETRELVSQSLAVFSDSMGGRVEKLVESNEARLTLLQQDGGGKLDKIREESIRGAKELREQVTLALTTFSESLNGRVGQLTDSNERRMEALRLAVDERLKGLLDDNSKSLEQIRVTVDEKLQGTLEKRLGESFQIVSERLEQVYKGLGEMQALAVGVGDLKKVLTNVKTRGTWGEVQLGALLEQCLAPDQYEANVPTRGTEERVEFAIKLPNRGNEDQTLWLPIDAKFPVEDYQRLIDAEERGDVDGCALAGKFLENRIKQCAADICQKYVGPPLTTDFAILFLPTEGLFAEVLRRPGLADGLQRDCRVIIAGPTTLWSILNSLQMGFRTLAIQQRSSEVWNFLGAVKTEFQKYAGVLEKVQKKLQEATNTVDSAAVRTRAIQKKLRHVQEMTTDTDGPAPLLITDALKIANGE